MVFMDRMRTKHIIYTSGMIYSTVQESDSTRTNLQGGTYNHKQFQIHRFYTQTSVRFNDIDTARLPCRAVESDVSFAGRRLQRDLFLLAGPVDVVALDDIAFEVVQEHLLMGPTYQYTLANAEA